MVCLCVIDLAKKIADKCVDPILGYIGTEVGHLWNYSTNLKKLEEEVGHLNDETRRMKDRIEDAGNRSGETRVDAGAERWLTEMAHLSDVASRIIEEEERETGRCLMGLRPNLWACYLASKSAKKVMDDAEELKKNGESIKKVAHVDYSQALGFEINTHFEELESRKKASEQIVAYLKGPSVKVVGMYGMGGTGKTTLAEKIGVQLYEDETFRYVVKTVVSNNQNTDLIRIQKQIADLLKISLGDEKDDVMARATRLRDQLVKKDKVLIILDDIWSSFELRDVGIPLDGELKVLITSRDVYVMNEMDSKHNVPLDVLSPEDSWKLFDRMAGGVAPDRYSTALEVVKQCGGIPVLLVTIARALRPRDLETWKEALLQLERFEGDKYVEDGYKRLEVSYNFLPNDELRSLFLLCAQLDHHFIPIDDLLKYTMGLGLFDRREKLREVRSRLHGHLGDLKGYCLLQEGNREGTVRMHDVVHKFAASIANRDRGISSTVAEAQLQEWPSKDEVEQLSISLPHHHLPPPDHQLPVAFDSSKLESFLFFRDKYEAFLNVPDEFFIGMKELKLVDIRRTSLSPVLCSSLNVLGKLRTLCLDYCKLDDVAVIGELPMLQVLSLKGSTVSQIERLGSNLKLLDLRDCGQLKVIASGVFCNLTLLEDLRIGGSSFDKWEPLQGCNSGSDHETSTTKKLASLREFKNLGNLINLDIKIPDPKAFPKDLVFKNVERFNVVIGDPYYWGYAIDSETGDPYYWGYAIDSETLKVKLVEDIQLYEGIKVLMRKAKKLHLEGIQGVTSVCELLDMRELERMCDDHRMLPVGSLQNLTSIHVSSCNVLKYLFSPHLALRGLSCLKEISVVNCKSMESIVSRESENRMRDHHLMLPVRSLQNLTSIRVTSCNVLKYLFSPHLALRGLSCLKEISVKYCKSMETIVSRVDEEEEIIEFTQLRKLELIDLGGLISFYSSSNSTPNPIISSSQERQEQDHISLFNKKLAFPNLEEMRIGGCPNLTSIFPASVALTLKQLENLTINHCENLKEIVSDEEEEDGGPPTFVFPRLTKLFLWGLPELERFYGGGADISDWPSLVELHVLCCDKLIDPSNLNLNIQKIITTPSLKTCKLQGRNVGVTYESLSGKLDVTSCNVLKYLFSSHLALRGLSCLKEIRVEDCKSMESIVSRESENRITGDEQLDDEEEEIIEFTQLRKLELIDLGRFSSFYSSVNSTPNPIISSSLERQEQDHISLFNKKLAFPNLEEVRIDGIHKVKMISENQLHLNLRDVTVSRCPNLTSIFPVSVALALKQLERLVIIDCENLKEIVSNEEEEDGGPPTFVFPRLTSLNLERLPELERFYGGGVDISDWPSLIHLDVNCCDKLIYLSNLNIQKIITTPSLEVCNLQGTNVGVRYKSLSGKLKVDGDIKRIGCSSVFPIALFEMFQELKKLHIARFCFEQLFPCEPDVGNDHDIDTQAILKKLARTTFLKLSHLSEMKHIWSEQYADDQFDGIPLNLEILEVKSCGSVMSLAPKSALFQNLTRLVVRGCNELIKLIASSTTAKSLVNLTEMRVSECDSLKEIVAIYDDHDGEEASNNTTEDIVFGKLEILVLESLRRLTSFTTNNCNFQFPSLEQVFVAECPNMEFFSKGALSTPKLSKVRVDIDDYDEEEGRSMSESDDYDEEEGRSMWESDLNSTVRQLYKAMNSTEEYLEPE